MAQADQRELRLRTSVHYSVGKICEDVGSQLDVPFSKEAIALLTEVTMKQFETFAADLDAFAKHGKRQTINCDDVKLLVRRNESLLAHIGSVSDKICGPPKEKKKRTTTTKEKGKKTEKENPTKEAEVVVDEQQHPDEEQDLFDDVDMF